MGPFEYLRPLEGDWEGPTEKCGCFNHGENSYFPADTALQQSVCDWQDAVIAALSAEGIPVPYAFCRLEICASEYPNNEQVCADIKKYGLDNVPTGNLFNSPYPDTQYDIRARYPNQDTTQTNSETDSSTGPTDSLPSSTPTPKFLRAMPYLSMIVMLVAVGPSILAG
jgi:hypothetical protein